MRVIKSCLFIALVLLTLPVFAKPMAQRNCTPNDLQITQDTINVETQCAWAANDDHDMQITLHSQDVTIIKGTCIFTAGADGKANDAILEITGHKAAHIVDRKIHNNVIEVIIRNDFSDNNLNVLFYLNKADHQYSEGNKLHCSFSPMK